jgi:hypothetical protein
MHLSAAQLTVLRNAILAETDPELVALRTAGATGAMAEWYNRGSTFVVWKTLVPNSEVGRAFVASSLSAMTSGNNDRLVSFALWNPEGVQPFRADHRQFFDDVFSPASGAATRAALLTLWKRFATRAERLYATGTGSDATPGQLVVEGSVDDADIVRALAG